MTEKVTLSVVDSIAYLTINAPPKNEMDLACFEDLSRIARKDLGNLNVDGMIVSGKGRHFSSGANVPELIQMGDDDDYQSDPQ